MKFLQKLGKSLMLPVATLPICGILMGIGYLLFPGTMQGFAEGYTLSVAEQIGYYLVKAGGAVIDNMAILFAIGVGVGMSEDNDGTGGLAALVSWLMITKLLDPTGTLQPGAILCPPEGDAGTGMAATNAVAKRTGNVSAGTSVFSMIVLEKPLSRRYEEIDMVTTPDGAPVAMVHCNNCTNEINAWAEVFSGLLTALGHEVDKNALYTAMFTSALEGKADGDGLLLYNYLSGEPVTGLSDGRPLLVRGPEAHLNFANFMRTQLYSALATLKVGLDILGEEHVAVDRLMGHGGFFKTPVVGQRIMAAAANSPVAVMETAGEGGPYGMALLSAYMLRKAEGETLEQYLNNRVFAGAKSVTLTPEAEEVAGFDAYLTQFKNGLKAQRAAVETI